MFSRRSGPIRVLLFAAPLVFALSGCENNPFEPKQTPLPGERQPLFPEGVPGVEFSAPPPQPLNSNIPIPSQIGADEGPDANAEPHAEQPIEARPPAQAARTQQRPSGGNPDDAWEGSR